jgi:hypothetical protein
MGGGGGHLISPVAVLNRETSTRLVIRSNWPISKRVGQCCGTGRKLALLNGGSGVKRDWNRAMPSKFRIELDVVLDTDSTATVIEFARRNYVLEGGVTDVGTPTGEGTIPAPEFIAGIEHALMELVERNPLFAEANVEVDRLSCTSEEAPSGSVSTADDLVENSETAVDLDDFETGMYLCRWPNGEFSFVKADDRNDAVVQLDEWAGAEPAWLIPMDTCMVDFRLNDRGEIELGQFGEETREFVWAECYPELDELLSSDDVLGGNRSPEAVKKIRKAVEHERKRLWNAQGDPTPAKTALGRELQKRLGTVGPVADRYVEAAANQILRARMGKSKPN